MAFPVIKEKYLGEFPKEKPLDRVKAVSAVATAKVYGGVSGILDGLIILVAAFWYYLFTGLAIWWGRKIPEQWLRLGTHLGMAQVAPRFKKADLRASERVALKRNTPERSFKVVDIDTKRPLKVLKSVK